MSAALRSLRGGVALVALAVGGMVVWVAPSDETAEAPFVRAGDVGDVVALEYADVSVTDVLAADQLSGALDGAVPAGTFLLADVELLVRGGSTRFDGVYVRDSEGRLHGASGTAGCTISGSSTNVPAGVRYYARYCFDLPRSALAGAVLVVSRGAGHDDGVGWRRDDVAEIDLGISEAEADGLWDAELAYEPWAGGIRPPAPTVGPPAAPQDVAPMLGEGS
jgi:hypothetical protein